MIDRRIGPYFLTALKAPQTPDMVRAVLAWGQIESGGAVSGNNPWNLHSWGGLSGQTGYRYAGPGDRNVAVFDTLEHGVAACAANLTRYQAYGYPKVVLAARASQPVDFLNALAASSWSAGRYGTKNGGPNKLIRIYEGLHPTPVPVPSNGVAPVKYVNASGYDLTSLPKVAAPVGTPILDFEGKEWTKLGVATSLKTTGLADGHSGLFTVVVSTGRYYKDKAARPTWQLASIPGGTPA